MEEEILDQESVETPEGQEPEGQQNLVDVTAVDEQGHQLWFPREAVVQLREEAANYRRLYQEAKQALESQKPTEPTQDDTVTKRLTELEARERQLVIENAILAQAAVRTNERGAFIRPAEAVRLIDRSLIKIGDNGQVEGVDEALKALAAESPHLLEGRRPAKVSPTNPGNPGQAVPAIVKELEARLSGSNTTFGAGGVVASDDME